VNIVLTEGRGRERAVVEEKVLHYRDMIAKMIGEIEKVIVGQRYLIERLLVALFANGHLLIEGVPGLAKTTSVKVLADCINAQFQRIQFTPDLLPADLIGTLIFNPKEGNFATRRGPIFTNILLADEINRAPAKVQSALLEAMEERQVTIGENTFKLEGLFLVMATQNPIEQEGTYALPEAQMDRFMFKLNIRYPTIEEENLVLKRMGKIGRNTQVAPVMNLEDILAISSVVDEVYMDEKIETYILDLVFATRFPDRYGLNDLSNLIAYGASPRATINLAVASKAYAFLKGRGYVTPQDIKSICPDVLRHRIIVSYEAEAEEITAEHIVSRILQEIKVP
jgi:MoxR-like ATPase